MHLLSVWTGLNQAYTSQHSTFTQFFAKLLRLCQVTQASGETTVLKSSHKVSNGLCSGLWLSHCQTFTLFSLNHSCVALALCSAGKQIFSSRTTRFHIFDSFGLLHWFSFFSRACCQEVPCSMMLPPPCFTDVIVCLQWRAVFTKHSPRLMAKTSILVSSDYRSFVQLTLESPTCLWVNSRYNELHSTVVFSLPLHLTLWIWIICLKLYLKLSIRKDETSSQSNPWAAQYW